MLDVKLIGDIHGRIFAVKEAYNQFPNSLIIQLGDFGFRDTYRYLENYDPKRLKIIHGNHDEIGELVNYKHFLGRYGIIDLPGELKAFFISGAWSIDKASRTPGLDWWPEEELSLEEQEECFEFYKENYDKIDILLTHDAPNDIQKILVGEGRSLFGGFYPNSTGKFLQRIWEHKQPERWYFGHWHQSWNRQLGNTLFRCVDIDEVVTI